MAKPPSTEARIFLVDTRFQKLARRAGGLSKDKAVERAQDQIEKVKSDFDQWLDNELRELTSLIADAEAGKAEANWIENANARCRQLCDSSGTLGFQLLFFVAGSLCDILDSIEGGAECNMEAIVCHVNALNLAAQKSYRPLHPEQVPELTEGLRRVVQHVVSEYPTPDGPLK
jgi:hypothetical protein